MNKSYIKYILVIVGNNYLQKSLKIIVKKRCVRKRKQYQKLYSNNKNENFFFEEWIRMFAFYKWC